MLTAVDKSLSSSLADARDALINAVVDMLTAYRAVQGASLSSSSLLCPYQLRHVALNVLAMLKSVSLTDNYFDVEFSLHTHTHNRFTALWNLSGTTRVSRYQKKHSPTHTHRGHQSSLSAFSIYYDPWHPPYSFHVLYSLFPQSLQVLFALPLGLVSSTSYSIHFFTQSLCSFCRLD